ncbi:MAG TPA: hypothetical protein VKZ63_10005 [Kofleriaceae bacterium]|nr:hypothetical protein [Kofleriaceae bacterium]
MKKRQKKQGGAPRGERRRLSIVKETLRTLQTDELAEVVGGIDKLIPAIQATRYCL